MLTPQAQAMVSGTQSGQQQAQSILPSTFQPQGRPQPTNPFEGVLNLVNNQILQVTYGVGQQGQNTREVVAKLLKISYEIQKINNELTDMAIEGKTSSSSQPQPQQQQLPYYGGQGR